MPRVIEVRGHGYFTVALPSTPDEAPRLVPALPHVVTDEKEGANIPTVIPHADEPTVPEECPVSLSDDGTGALIAGHTVPSPRGVGDRAVRALIEAFPGGLSRAALNKAANAADARAALSELARREPLWDAALRTPRTGKDHRDRNGLYRIALKNEIDWAVRLMGWMPEEEARMSPLEREEAAILAEEQSDARTLASVLDEVLTRPTPHNT